MSGYSGSCHCGAITFHIEVNITELLRCDCSICTKKNALMTNVHEDDFTLINGKDNLGEYRWNTKVVRKNHYPIIIASIYSA